MNDVENLYQDNHLIVRAMDLPTISKKDDEFLYDCSVWANEFSMMENHEFSSVSGTLIIPGISVSTYKNCGYLLDANITDCFHIASSDSGSCGNLLTGDFQANPSDFNTIEELAEHIITTSDKTMNEVNMNFDITSVVGLFINKCGREFEHLKSMLYVKDMLEKVYNIDLDIYEYDRENGAIKKLELTDELRSSLMDYQYKNAAFNTPRYMYYTDYDDDIYTGDISEKSKTLN